MAEALKFTTLDAAVALYSDLPWRKNGAGEVSVFDAKKEEYATIKPGQFLVSIGERFEVHDEEPEKAKHVEAPDTDASADAPADEGQKTTRRKTEKPRENSPEGIKGPVTRTSEEIE